MSYYSDEQLELMRTVGAALPTGVMVRRLIDDLLEARGERNAMYVGGQTTEYATEPTDEGVRWADLEEVLDAADTPTGQIPHVWQRVVSYGAWVEVDVQTIHDHIGLEVKHGMTHFPHPKPKTTFPTGLCGQMGEELSTSTDLRDITCPQCRRKAMLGLYRILDDIEKMP